MSLKRLENSSEELEKFLKCFERSSGCHSVRAVGGDRMSKLYKAYAKLPDGTKRVVHSIDFSNRYVEVVDYLGYDGLAEWCLEDVDIIFSQPELDDNQQIVLNCLKKIYNKNEIKMNISAVFWVLHQNYLEDEFSKESLAYEELSFEKESQVVKVFINLLEKEESE